MYNFFSIDVEVVSSPDATIATLTSSGDIVGIGTAKRHPSDENDEAYGINLAVVRAIQDYLDSLDPSLTVKTHRS